MDDKVKKVYRLCLVSDQLATGGAERCAALLSNYFFEQGFYVHHVVVVDKVEYDYSGKVLNLGKLKNKTNGIFNRFRRFLVLNRFFARNQFDYVIDFRVKRFQLQEFIIARYLFRSPLIVTVHSYMTHLYFPRSLYLANRIYKHCVKIICVSEVIKQRVASKYSYTQLQTLYNPVDFKAIARNDQSLEMQGDFILAVGRMYDQVKQFDKLIDTYAESDLPKMGIKLVFLGDGNYRRIYQEKAKAMGLAEQIIFKGKIRNPFHYMKAARFMVLCSKNEGFPSVLIESLACGTPVVAFDCLSGPSEIVIPEKNGILVANQDFKELTAALNRMATNQDFYLHCKQNAKASVEAFSLDKIGEAWVQLFKSNP